MGMFDNVICDYPLPEHTEFQDSLFQTKDTSYQYLGYYRITEEGHLEFKEHWDDEYQKLADYDGAIKFYEIPDNGGWVEYIAVFVDGKLVKLKLLEFTIKEKEESDGRENNNGSRND